MPRLETALHNDIKALELLRDQLKLHAHLLKAEAKDRWEELEKKRDMLKAQLDKAKRAADAPKQELDAAARHLCDALKSGYEDLKKALKT